VAGDILLIAVGSMMVVDGINGLMALTAGRAAGCPPLGAAWPAAAYNRGVGLECVCAAGPDATPPLRAQAM
jgi:hypothetical protein